MAIIGFIVKLILYLLLGVLGLALLILLLFLVLPIAYEGKLRYDDSLWLQAKIKIFYILRLEVAYQEELFKTKILLFGKEMVKEDEEEEEEEEMPHSLPPLNEVEQESVPHTEPKVVDVLKQDTKDTKDSKDTSQTATKAFTKPEPVTDVETANKRIGDSIKEAWKIAEQLWNDTNRRGFVGAIGKLFKGLWHAIRPQHFRFYLKVGKEQPDETGQLLAWLACLFPFYAQYGYIVGDFEKSGIEGEGELAGKFNIWRLIKPVIMVVCNRSVREYIHLILHIRKDKNHGIKTQQ